MAGVHWNVWDAPSVLVESPLGGCHDTGCGKLNAIERDRVSGVVGWAVASRVEWDVWCSVFQEDARGS